MDQIGATLCSRAVLGAIPMSEAIRRLNAEEMWTAVEAIDPVGVLAEELIDRTVGNEVAPAGRLAAWTEHRGTTNGSELVVFDHPDAAARYLLPATSLRMFTSAALAALAARELLVPGGVTVALLGASPVTHSQLSVVARHVPDISHVAVCLAPPQSALPVRLTEQLELSGIRLSVMPTVVDTIFGANLVVTTEDGATRQDTSGMRIGHLARGTVLINTTGRDLPAELVDHVDELYVDDLALLPACRDRYFVARHLEERARSGGVGGYVPRIAADLGQLLAGRHRARRHGDNIVLVELLGARRLNVRLADHIRRAAERIGLGCSVEP